MKKWLFAAVFLMVTALAVQAQSNGTITFQGQIVAAQPGQELTRIVPQQTTDSQGNMQTVYAVQSVPTGVTLATFPNHQDAQTFANQVTVSVAYRTP